LFNQAVYYLSNFRKAIYSFERESSQIRQKKRFPQKVMQAMELLSSLEITNTAI